MELLCWVPAGVPDNVADVRSFPCWAQQVATHPGQMCPSLHEERAEISSNRLWGKKKKKKKIKGKRSVGERSHLSSINGGLIKCISLRAPSPGRYGLSSRRCCLRCCEMSGAGTTLCTSCNSVIPVAAQDPNEHHQ